MPLQTSDGQYMNQPSYFLPLAQEARKLAQKINQEEETMQWSGIPPSKANSIGRTFPLFLP